MGEAVRVGQPIPLSLQLSDEVTNAFVEANIFDADKVELTSSPVELVHDDTGHYINNSILYPFTDRIFAIIRVFTNNTKLKRHPRHRNTIEDIFPRDVDIRKLIGASRPPRRAIIKRKLIKATIRTKEVISKPIKANIRVNAVVSKNQVQVKVIRKTVKVIIHKGE